MSLLLIYVIAAVAVGMFASIRRNRNGFGWFVLSLFISPIITFVFCAILREIDESGPIRIGGGGNGGYGPSGGNGPSGGYDFDALPASERRRLERLNADLHDRTDAADAAAHWQLRR
jgi:hypothetical protein